MPLLSFGRQAATPEAPPANWRELRRRWDAFHAVRVGVLLVALVLLVVSCLVSSTA